MREETFEGVGGLKIFFRAWLPASRARGAVVLSHGFNSHSGYFTWAAERFAARGYAVYALDHRGRGRSEGERFYVEKVSHYVEDLHSLVKLTKKRQPGLPVFLLGHSAGGVISCVYSLEHQAELTGLICESFAFQVYAPDVVLSAVRGFSHVAPHTHVLTLKNEHFSRDPKVVELMNQDSLIAKESQPSLTVAEMARADERLSQEFPLLTLPILILHGGADKVTKPSGSELFFQSAGSSDKTLKIYENHYHDLLNDDDRELVMSDILEWVGKRTPEPARVAEASA
ncbi:MAG TPA: alpha/beta hydrolase [Polyangiaceae bacterium]|nr:alpha/beta hydrolase [Polyangiaceae bacterium]